MRGNDFFPRYDVWADNYDHRLERWKLGQVDRNFTTRPVTMGEFEAIYINMLPEYEGWLAGNNMNGETLWSGISEIDVSALPEKTYDRPKLRPFKLEYDTLEEVKMRFKGTCILVKGNPFYVSDTRVSKRKFYLLIEDILDKKNVVCLDNVSDFRSPPPGYIQIETEHAYMTRIPARVNQQGLNNQNTVLRRVASGRPLMFNTKGLVQAIESKGKTTPWNAHFLNLMNNQILPEFRLSDEIALFTKKNNAKIYVAYKGRIFGTLNENVVSAYDEDDLIQPWFKKHFDKVNLEIKA